jgi:hypothetical protein
MRPFRWQLDQSRRRKPSSRRGLLLLLLQVVLHLLALKKSPAKSRYRRQLQLIQRLATMMKPPEAGAVTALRIGPVTSVVTSRDRMMLAAPGCMPAPSGKSTAVTGFTPRGTAALAWPSALGESGTIR